ncbi:MAG TPA: hypothetical protein VGA64_04735, partial [Candidatus Polarisedimenticolia bacterium]
MTPSRAYLLFVLVAVVLSLLERAYAAANERRILREGGEEIAPWVFRLMVPIYVLIFVVAPTEQAMRGRLPPAGMVIAMGGLFLAAK